MTINKKNNVTEGNELLMQFGLISIAVIPFVVVLFYLFVEINSWVQFAEKEQKGVEYHTALQVMLSHTQQHRGMVSAYLGGNNDFEKRLQQKSADIHKQIFLIEMLDKKYGALLQTSGRWQQIKPQLSGLTKHTLVMSADESFYYHTNLINETLEQMHTVIDNSNLVTDPELYSNYMVDVITRIPKATEYSGQARALGSGIAAQKTMTSPERTRLIELSTKITNERDAFAHSISVAASDESLVSDSLLRRFEDSKHLTSYFLQAIEINLLGSEGIAVTAEDYFTIATRAIDAEYDLYSVASSTLFGQLQKRVDGYKNRKYLATGLALLVGLVGVLIYGLFFRNQMRRKLAERELQDHRGHLEEIVEQRTAKLQATTTKLEQEKSISENHEVKLKELSQMMLQLQEDERRRVSRELHDGIIQTLVSLKYKVELVENKANFNDMTLIDDLQVASMILNDAIEEVRRISHDLRPTLLDDLGLFPAIRSLVRELSERSSLHVSLHLPEKCAEVRLQPEVATSLYRIIQETITNVEKHANASTVELAIRCSGTNYTVLITDNGKGFDVETTMQEWGPSSGIGLRNIQERVGFLNGEFVVVSDLQKGTRIEIIIPLATSAVIS